MTATTRSVFGEVLAELLEARGIAATEENLAEVAVEGGLDPERFIDRVTGATDEFVGKFQKIADALGLTLDERKALAVAYTFDRRPETKDQDASLWERAEEVRRMVKKLPVEDQKRGALLKERSSVLHDAVELISGRRLVLTSRRREDVAQVLAEMRAEIDAEFRAFREERGIPEL